MKCITHINRVSEFFFLLIGTAYLISFLSWKNNFYPFETEIFLLLADLPLAFFGILYAFTSVRLSLSLQIQDDENEDLKSSFSATDFLVLFFAIVLIGGIVYVDLFYANRFSFPKLS